MRYTSLLLLAFGFHSNLCASTMTINIENIKNEEGTIKLALYENPDLWLQKGKALKSYRLKTDENTDHMTIVIEDLEDIEYGLALHHDTNKNDKMDIKLFPPGPAEGYAFSNIDKIGLKKPTWDQCRYDIRDNNVVYLSVVYP